MLVPAGGPLFWGPRPDSSMGKRSPPERTAKGSRPLPVPLALSAAAETYRKNYREFRKGGAKGAKGEVSSEALAASSVRASKAQHRRTSSGGVSLAVRALLPQGALPGSPIESPSAAQQPRPAQQQPPAQQPQQMQRSPSEEQPSFDLLAALRGSIASGWKPFA